MCPYFVNSCFFPGRLVYLLSWQDKRGIKSEKNGIKIFEEYDQKQTDLVPSSLEDFVEPKHPTRIISDVMDSTNNSPVTSKYKGVALDNSEGYVIELRGIVKRFPGVVANDGIDLKVHRGEIHCLLGENGAGKTTLMRVLYGLYRPDEGEIILNGQPVQMTSPRAALNHHGDGPPTLPARSHTIGGGEYRPRSRRGDRSIFKFPSDSQEDLSDCQRVWFIGRSTD